MDIRLFLPFPRIRSRENHNRAGRETLADFLNRPQSLNVAEFNVDNAQIDATRLQKRLRLFDMGAMNNSILIGIQCRSNRFREIWVLSQNHNRFHRRLSHLLLNP